MKNLVVHLHPSKEFDPERARLARVLVDNSYELGWAAEDLLLVTNFPWKYNGVRAVEVGDEHFCACRPRSTHTVIVPHLFDLGVLRRGEMVWLHDSDAYQEVAFGPGEPELGAADLGLSDYGWSPKWNVGSVFFDSPGREIFEWVREVVYERQTEDERALMSLTRQNYQQINARIRRLNITYNFGMRQVEANYARAELPLRVLHFHPSYRERGGFSTRKIFFEGRNGLNRPLVSPRLRRIFADHGI